MSPKNEDRTQFKEFNFPPIWEDKAKMKVLLSTFHPRHFDCDQYDSKMMFWIDLIKQYCYYAGKANISVRELQLQFMRGEQMPACLDMVVSHMDQQKQIRLRSDYEYDPLNSWSGWFVNSFVRRPLSRSWLKLKHSIIAENVEAQSMVEWIHLEVMQGICDEMEKKVLFKNRGKLLHFEAFKALCEASSMHVHPEFLPLCLLTLQTRRQVVLDFKIERKTRCIHLIKIPASEQESLVITESDHAVHNLQVTQGNLLKQLEELEDEIKLNDDKARQYVKENKRQLAKTYLRKRNLLEKSHERRSLALNNIETLLTNVDEAKNTGVVLDAYKIGSKTLQKVLNESGLKYDNVDEVLADVRETLEQHREVQDVLSTSSTDVAGCDEDALEKELRDLIGESAAVQPDISINNNKPEIVIDDEQLIAMLNDLEVEEGSIISQVSHKTLGSA
ncbi:CG5498 [Drosophila busckii]|uniref:CG5498 n=1 Tax=Drosophila busckii TaxID=30019 RepID=A0A0M3QWA8_DROBS|nr:charged multivesicular body protein 7 [Drosophila busckii]ALC43823.1 CG5498 [Drosophila busckii]